MANVNTLEVETRQIARRRGHSCRLLERLRALGPVALTQMFPWHDATMKRPEAELEKLRFPSSGDPQVTLRLI